MFVTKITLVSISVLAFIFCCKYSEANDVYKNDTLEFSGKIDENAYLELGKFFKRGGKTILIKSEGGDARYGQLIGELMVEFNVNLIVNQYCLSSCANYLFLAARQKTVPENAIVGFHGGININKEIDYKKDISLNDRSFIATMHFEDKFFKKIGVDHQLIDESAKLTRSEKSWIHVSILGKTNEKKKFSGNERDLAIEYLAEQLKRDPDLKWEMNFKNEINNTVYFPSKTTLEKYGVANIKEYSYPTDQDHLNILINERFEGLTVIGDFGSTAIKNIR